MMTQIARRVFTLALIVTAIFSLSVALTASSDTARASVPAAQTQAIVKASAQAKVVYPRSKRRNAFAFALTQKGDPYRYGATGPSSWDCSGLVQWAYRKAGLSIPRTTGGMMSSARLVRTYHPLKGDLAFFSSGHVELYVSGTKTNGYSYGAHRSGTRVGYRKYNGYYHPAWFMHVKRAN